MDGGDTHASESRFDDPLFRLLHDRLKLRLGHTLGLLLAVNVIQMIVAPYFHYRSLGGNLFVDFDVKDIQVWLNAFVTQPVMLIVYWTTVTLLPGAFDSLYEKKVLKSRGRIEYPEFKRDLEHRMAARGWQILIPAAAVIAIIFYQLVGWGSHRYQGDYGVYPYTDLQQYLFMSLHGLFRFMIVGWTLVRGLVYIDGLQRLWRDFDADVKPLHPDGSGGFSAIGDRTLQTGLFVGVSGLFIATTLLTNREYNLGDAQLLILLVLLVLTILLAPLAFAIPIWSTHTAMLAARRRRLDAIARQFDELWLDMDDGAEQIVDATATEKLRSLMSLHDMTRNHMPVWPFGGADVGLFGLSLTPLLVFGVSAVAEFLVSDFLSQMLKR